jgi:hypothetical protein
MSSAILYLAIIAIWAGVLIPRWLRRDSARGHQEQDVSNLPTDEAGTSDDFASAPVPADELDECTGDVTATVPDGIAAPAEEPDAEVADEEATGTRSPSSPAESRRRVLAARRRLLWMMLALEAAADVLAASGLAAWWVIAPPTVMLAGYLLLLREAAQADAERDARDRDAAQVREEARNARGAARTMVAEHPPASPAAFAAAPVPEDYEDLDSGRDFTPGGRFGVSGDASAAEDDAYDQYTEERLRAVGD